jgi:dimeric dUTPase (all-alpha-NTP-PPase superfamily)
MADQLFGSWLAETRALQLEAYDEDPSMLSDEAFAEFIRWNVLAATHELHEFLDHVQWKPWSKKQGEVRDRDDAVEELVDVLHFVGNLLVAFNVDALELNLAYHRKAQVNRDRQEAGYVGRGFREGD